MPRDKQESHEKIIAAAREEFLEKGFENASIRSIAARAGLTSAALYRHFESKEEMFAALVAPALRALEAWEKGHVEKAYAGVEAGEKEQYGSLSEADMIREVVVPYRDDFKLLLCCAQGTKYEHFIHDFVERDQKAMMEGLQWMKQQGFPVMDISEEGLHLLLSAYITALFEPIVHDYPTGHTEEHLQLIEQFFMPGWHAVLGI